MPSGGGLPFLTSYPAQGVGCSKFSDFGRLFLVSFLLSYGLEVLFSLSNREVNYGVGWEGRTLFLFGCQKVSSTLERGPRT